MSEPAIKRALEIVNTVEWSGDMRVNMTTVIGAGRVLAKALQERDAARSELADRDAWHKAVMSEECGKAERHCTCVPELRREIDRLRGSWDALAAQQLANERVQQENRQLRGLLETAVDAWDSGQWNSLLGVQMCGLPRAWMEKTREVLKWTHRD